MTWLWVVAVTGLISASEPADRPQARATGRVFEVEPTRGRLVVRVEARGAASLKTFRVEHATNIVGRVASTAGGEEEPSLPTAIELTELSPGDDVLVIYRSEKDRLVASFIEKRP